MCKKLLISLCYPRIRLYSKEVLPRPQADMLLQMKQKKKIQIGMGQPSGCEGNNAVPNDLSL